MGEQQWQGDLQQLILGFEQGRTDLSWLGYDLCVFKYAWGELVISLAGGQVLLFRPTGEQPLLWLSDKPAKAGAIRGGVPVCWPWFAEHVDNASQPKHGVARTAHWTLDRAEVNAQGGHWQLSPPASLWSGLDLTLDVDVDQGELRLSLISHNYTDQRMALTAALHSYFAVSDRAGVALQGVDGLRLRDKLQGMQERQHSGVVEFPVETDVIFQHEGDSEVMLVDHGWQRVIAIRKQGGNSTVVWNPGDAAVAMPDVGLDQVSRFVCVEAARTRFYDHPWLDAGESQTLTTAFRLLPYSQ
ncbi:D-hexose-6-phosphate mutarotase [Amphritea sp.]|uniref:D-hexose-6-phosphate mutarotase n=1 Tax=Amphritea sp. TaxID=1872502 RepID=UPI003A8FD427